MGNALENIATLIPAAGWQRIMVDVLWQGALIGVVAMLSCRWLVRQAAARAWLMLIALTACVVVPATSALSRSMGWAVPIRFAGGEWATQDSMRIGVDPRDATGQDDNQRRVASATNRSGADQASHRLADSHSVAAGSRSVSIANGAPPRTRVWRIDLIVSMIGCLWLISSLFLLFRLVMSVIAVRRMINRSRRCEDAVLLQSLSDTSRIGGLNQPPRLLLSEQIATPMVLAYFDPVLLIPATHTTFCEDERFATTFAHELAHILRRDGWARLWVQLIAILVPLQPLVWWMRKRFLEACEEACDDWAVAIGCDPVDLASVLTNWSDGRRNQRELVLAVGMSGTRTRVLRLLAMKEVPRAVLSVRWRLSATLAAVLLCVGLGVAQPPGATEQTEHDSQPSGNTVRATEQPAVGDRQLRTPIASTTSNSIAGTCVDENDEPLPGTHVQLFRVGQDAAESSRVTQTLIGSARCDDQGRFALNRTKRSAEPATWIVIAQHAGRATAAAFVTADRSEEQVLTLKLHPAATLRGRVVDADGKPVSGATVSTGSALIQPIPGICADVSDEDGYYAITDLSGIDVADQKPRPLGDGSYEMIGQRFAQIRHPEYARDLFQYSKIPGVANVTLQRPAVVQGRVVFEGTETPAVGARIEFWNDMIAPDEWTRATADAEGRYRIEGLPPGTYRVSVRYEGRPNRVLRDVTLSAGDNDHDFEMGQGGIVRGRVIDVSTGQAIQLADDETMDISEADESGRWFLGMPSASIQPDGSFSLKLSPGRRYLGMYLGPNWRGVNTDQLAKDGIDVIAGEVTEIEVRVKHRSDQRPSDPRAVSKADAMALAEQAAIAAINRLGGWVEMEPIGGVEHVVEVNMVYHKDERTGREENQLISDECLFYVQKFSKLKRLMLYREQATDTGLAQLRGMDSLEKIWIWDGSAVSDVGAAHLGQLKNLTVIHLSESNITDAALGYFSKMPNIEKLSLQGSRFTNEGLESLQESKQLKELVVGLGPNEITDDGLRHLSGLTNLSRLGLQNTKITDAGLTHLRSLNNLRELWVSGTAVTESGLNALRQQLPKLE